MAAAGFAEDPLLARPVVLAERRAKRPHPTGVQDCPFCPGREGDTPPAKLVYVVKQSGVLELSDREASRVQGWAVRCFDNLYPIVPPELGGHEVVVETPLHDEHPHKARVEQLALALKAALSRMNALYACGASYVALFRNHGREAGASIPHPHTQLVALPFIPRSILSELEAFKQGCPLCRGLGEPFLEDGGFIAAVPEAPLQPYEFRLYPRAHEPSPLSLSDEELVELARALKRALAALAEALNDPPYNLWLHAAPPSEGWEAYHWHIEVRPRLSVHAGLEQGFEVYVCSKPPSEVVGELKAALRPR